MNSEQKLEAITHQMERARCEVKGILIHRNGKVNATFMDLMSKKKGWGYRTTSHKSVQATIEYFSEIGDYIEGKGMFEGEPHKVWGE